MLSSIGRAAIRRLIPIPIATSSSRIGASGLSANSLRSGRLFVRSFATPGRPKASTTTKSATTKPAATKGRPKGTTKATATAKDTATKASKATRTVKATKSTKSAKPKPKSKAKPRGRPKTKPKKRQPISPEKKLILERRELKVTAIFAEPKKLPDTAWTVFVVEKNQGIPGGSEIFRAKMTGIGQEYKTLSSSQLQRLQDIAEQNRLANVAAYKAWTESYSPQEIYNANNARRLLKKKHNYPPKSGVKIIRDDRLPKQPTTPFSLFTKARWATGDFANKSISESSKALGVEWQSLSEAERAPYFDLFKVSSDQYAKEVGEVFHRKVKYEPKA
ncbi:uncharacterized protein GGS22DRAFT_183325 [Annulohypoxylon maeteangense]|uniref:uncharacterized protein n=1 Tax=Annulohypoxylon maeteangense TaxID=1927788 RepID=UPI002007B9CD|nr:uncharacterized protein GGS22DRAFT_183325 [Annulohypoxylon maeteangense]KAI0889976.1 hypothetical protein GGS22DRAFT_183325 [Annulohypoxylon maeteangense]